MHKLLYELVEGFEFSSDISKDAYNLLVRHGNKSAAVHTLKVADEAARLAVRFGMDERSAATAGYLHDLGRVFTDDMNIKVAEELGIEVFQEEKINPGTLHQKLSRKISEDVFGIDQSDILTAVECHCTLRPGAQGMDLLLLVADKLSWDSKDNKPILGAILDGLDISLVHGAFAYLSYAWENKGNLKVLHPWLVEAYNDLRVKL